MKEFQHVGINVGSLTLTQMIVTDVGKKISIWRQCNKSDISRYGNAEKWTFDWVIAPSKFRCVVVEWVLGFNKKYLKFHFRH